MLIKLPHLLLVLQGEVGHGVTVLASMVPAVVVQGVAGLALCAEAAAMLEVSPIHVCAASPLSGCVGASGRPLFVEI